MQKNICCSEKKKQSSIDSIQIDPWNCCQNTELKPRSMFRCRLRHFSLPPSKLQQLFRTKKNPWSFWWILTGFDFFQGGWKVKGTIFRATCVPGTNKKECLLKEWDWWNEVNEFVCLFGEKMVELNQKVIWVIPWSQCSQWALTFTFLLGESATL